MRTIEADAVVIGAGAGGLCAAARLVHAGLRPIVVESLDRLGGRASTEVIDGFTVNVGAIALEVGGVFAGGTIGGHMEQFALREHPFHGFAVVG